MLMSCVIKSVSELIFSTYLDPHMHEERHLKLLLYTFAEELHNLTISFHFLRKNTRRYSFSVKTSYLFPAMKFSTKLENETKAYK